MRFDDLVAKLLIKSANYDLIYFQSKINILNIITQPKLSICRVRSIYMSAVTCDPTHIYTYNFCKKSTIFLNLNKKGNRNRNRNRCLILSGFVNHNSQSLKPQTFSP